MLLLENSKNEVAKKNLYLIFAQSNHSAYPQDCEQMSQFLLSQHSFKKNNNPNNNNWDKKGDKGKKDNNNKSEDKDDITVGTTGAHVGEAASDKDKTVAPNGSSSIVAHISDVTKTIVPSLR